MNTQWLAGVTGGVLNVVLVLAVAPWFEGILRKVTARIQSRQGPPLAQPYYDLLKLLGKEDLEVGVVPWMQRFAAGLALASVLAVAWSLPLGLPFPGMGGDVILLFYLLTLAGVATLLGGLAAGSTYSLMGISREMMAMMALEPLLAAVLLAGSLQAGSFRIEALLGGAIYGGGGFPWSGLMLAAVVLAAMPAFVQRVPFDMAEAETEIMEGAQMEYSGPKLALFRYARMVKLVLYAALFVAVFLPWGNGLMFPVGFLVFWGKVAVVVLGVTVVAATHARYRVDQAVRYFGGLLGVAVVALVLACYGR